MNNDDKMKVRMHRRRLMRYLGAENDTDHLGTDARELLELLDDLLEAPNLPTPRQQERLKYMDGENTEAYILRAWQAAEAPVRNVDGGQRLLRKILSEDPSWRDAEVAASVIQWLGTNIGRNTLRSLVHALDVGTAAQLEAERKSRAKPDDDETPTGFTLPPPPPGYTAG